jgi:hypothetical protein
LFLELFFQFFKYHKIDPKIPDSLSIHLMLTWQNCEESLCTKLEWSRNHEQILRGLKALLGAYKGHPMESPKVVFSDEHERFFLSIL